MLAWMLLSFVFSAPIPGTGSSRFADIYAREYWTPYGFQLRIPNRFIAVKGKDGAGLLMRLQGKDKTFVTVREFLGESITQSSLRSLHKDSHIYGLQVLRAEKISTNPEVNVIDLVSRDGVNKMDQTWLRQYIWVQEGQRVQLSCGGPRDKFSTLVQQCNATARSFAWVESASSTKKVYPTNL